MWWTIVTTFKGKSYIVSVVDVNQPRPELTNGEFWTSYGPYYQSKEELIEKAEITGQCTICDSPVSLRYSEPTRSELIEHGMCFTCNFWRLLIPKKHVIVNGVHFQDCEGMDTMGQRGHGGRSFYYVMENGRIFKSNNMWHQGTIPEWIKAHWPERFKNNARFISFDEYIELMDIQN